MPLKFLEVAFLLCLAGGVSSLQSSTSLLTSTQWTLNLDVGLQPGSWMPKRFPGWAETGARLGLGVQVEFTGILSSKGESLVGPKSETFQLAVTSAPSKLVSERGEETVEFSSGGWCIQRPTGSVRNAKGSAVRPEGLLRFWLDCPSGAKRRDVEILPSTRIFFTTGVWDNPATVEAQDLEYRKVLEELDGLKDRAREVRRESESQSMLQNIGTFRQLVGDSREFDSLKDAKGRYEQELPPVGSSIVSNGVRMAPMGSLVIKGNNIPDWLPGSEYLILGTFSTAAVEL